MCENCYPGPGLANAHTQKIKEVDIGSLLVVPSRGSRSDDHMITRRSNTNPLNLNTNELLDVLDVRSRLAGQVVVALCTSGRLLPSR